ncbi:DUF2968 domain-containing protein [Cupriavidus sp. H19C3]|uniref:DUF2968 domain-containing protein n=1 Tax=Cupriavidus sp. H19C3 TaxID=3241603 RepID=UPI003BF92277
MTKFMGTLRGALIVAAAVQCMAAGQAFAQSQPAQDAPAVAVAGAAAAAATATPAVDAAAAGTVRDLQARAQAGSIMALRKTMNGSYEAQYLFDRQTGTFFVTLLQQQNVWRVVKTNDETRATATYAAFVRQTERLSDVEMLRARTETQKTQVVQRLIAARETERRLEADLEVAQEQAKLAAERSQDERSQVQDLQAQQEAAQAELKETLSRIAKLQRQEKRSSSVARSR